jgi:hypothetical protein
MFPRFPSNEGRMKPPDANDIHREHGLDDLRRCLDQERFYTLEPEDRYRVEDDHTSEPAIDFACWRSSRYVGAPPPVARLVENSIPLSVPSLVAASGDIGKTTLFLELGRRAAFGERSGERPIFGGRVVQQGTAVILLAEDSAATVHRRISALDPDLARYTEKGERLIIVPLPDEGGPKALFTEKRGELKVTPFFDRFRDQLLKIPDLALIALDPLQAFVHARINEDPGAGQFVCSQLASLATETKAATVATHHMRKAGAGAGIHNPAAAREAVRGTTALIDGVRFAYALWPVEEAEAKRVCRELNVPFEPNRIVRGCVIKANEQARRTISTYARNEYGLLEDISDRLTGSIAVQSSLLESLTEAVRSAAAQGRPFTKTGKNGFYEQSSRLPGDLRGLSKHKLEKLADDALEHRYVVQAMAQGSKVIQWFDVPGGPFALGQGEFKHGAPR